MSLLLSLSFSLWDYFTPSPSLSSNFHRALPHPNFLLQTLIPFSLRKLKQRTDLLAFLWHTKVHLHSASRYSSFSCLFSYFQPVHRCPRSHPFSLKDIASVIVLSHSCFIKFPSLLDHSHQHTYTQLFPVPNLEGNTTLLNPSISVSYCPITASLFASLSRWSSLMSLLPFLLKSIKLLTSPSTQTALIKVIKESQIVKAPSGLFFSPYLTWGNSKRYWRTGKPGVLHSMGSKRVGYYLATEKQHLTWHRLVLFQKTSFSRVFQGNTPSWFSFYHTCLYQSCCCLFSYFLVPWNKVNP